MEKQPGKRARLSSALTNLHAQTIQNRSDLESMIEVTQDTMEDVVKVVLADLKLTILTSDEAIMDLQKEYIALLTERSKAVDKFSSRQIQISRWRRQDTLYAALPWWKKLFTSPWWRKGVDYIHATCSWNHFGEITWPE